MHSSCATQKQVARNEARVRRIFDLYQQRKEWIIQQTRSPYSIWALDFIFSNPISNASEFTETACMLAVTVRRILRTLAESVLLTTIQVRSSRRPAAYAYSELLEIVVGYSAV